MNPVVAFRGFTIAALLIDVLLNIYSYLPLFISEHLLWLAPEAVYQDDAARLASLFAANRYGALLTLDAVFDPVVHYGSLAFYAIASIGMVAFKNWARHLFLALCVFGALTLAASGLSVFTPFEATAWRVVGMIDGGLLALAYLSPLKDRFAPRAGASRNRQG